MRDGPRPFQAEHARADPSDREGHPVQIGPLIGTVILSAGFSLFYGLTTDQHKTRKNDKDRQPIGRFHDRLPPPMK